MTIYNRDIKDLKCSIDNKDILNQIIKQIYKLKILSSEDFRIILKDILENGVKFCTDKNNKYENLITQSSFKYNLVPLGTYYPVHGGNNSKKKHKIYTGQKGGQYIIKNNRKVYLSSK